MSKDIELMLARHETNKVINNMRRNPAAERYLKRKEQLRKKRLVSLFIASCLAIATLLFIWH